MTEPRAWTTTSTREVWEVYYERADGVSRRYMGRHDSKEKALEVARKGKLYGWNQGIYWGTRHIEITEASDDVEWLEE